MPQLNTHSLQAMFEDSANEIPALDIPLDTYTCSNPNENICTRSSSSPERASVTENLLTETVEKCIALLAVVDIENVGEEGRSKLVQTFRRFSLEVACIINNIFLCCDSIDTLNLNTHSDSKVSVELAYNSALEISLVSF